MNPGRTDNRNDNRNGNRDRVEGVLCMGSVDEAAGVDPGFEGELVAINEGAVGRHEQRVCGGAFDSVQEAAVEPGAR